jgi:4-amino-4-deoxy-L-arabinose transferase-like glycosyltransferase
VGAPEVGTHRLSSTDRIALGILLIVTLAVRLPGLAAPFVGPHEDDNARYSLAARNHIRYGLGVTRGTNCLAVATDAPRAADYYVNHPGTLSLLIAASFLILGESEAATRAVPLAFTLAAVAVLYTAVRLRWGLRAALIASLFVATTPFAAWYGKLATFMPLILPFGVWLADSIARHAVEGDDDGRRWGSAGECAAMAAAASIDYGAFFLVPALWIAFGPRKRLAGPTLAACVVALLLFGQIALASGPEGIARLLQKGLSRAGAGAEFGLGEFFTRQFLEYFWYGFTPVAALLAVWGVIETLRRREPHARFLLAIALWGVLYIAVFREAAQIHEYWQYYLIPAVAILFALGLRRLPAWAIVVIMLIFFDQSWHIQSRRYYGDTGWYLREFEAIAYSRSHARGDDIVLTREPMRSIHPAYYADRRFETDSTLLESFALKKARARAE